MYSVCLTNRLGGGGTFSIKTICASNIRFPVGKVLVWLPKQLRYQWTCWKVCGNFVFTCQWNLYISSQEWGLIFLLAEVGFKFYSLTETLSFQASLFTHSRRLGIYVSFYVHVVMDIRVWRITLVMLAIIFYVNVTKWTFLNMYYHKLNLTCV
jgi:hypothetical protein